MTSEGKPVIDPGATVNATIRRFPPTVSVFNRFGIDSCCGGEASLEDAAAEANVGIAALIDALEEAAGEGALR
jgi:regulator of cell morphogenesis and NO signaling